MYMNKTKRNLILASAIVNLIQISASLILSVLLIYNPDAIAGYEQFYYFISYSTNIIYALITFLAGLIGSIFLIYSIRQKGKFFRTSQGIYIAGFVIIILCGGFLPWLLLFISLFIPDVIVMNTKEELRQEIRLQEKENRQKEAIYEEKKKKIDDLKHMRDEGIISEEEYKQKLFEIL